MPQVAREVVKERARRLREKGAAALRRHLDGEVSKRREVLVESADRGRTEQFLPIRLDGKTRPGEIHHVTVVGHNGSQLLAAC
jgi:threonylcarbamoyladenosine tRNA methylthiotransferase MtaB